MAKLPDKVKDFKKAMHCDSTRLTAHAAHSATDPFVVSCTGRPSGNNKPEVTVVPQMHHENATDGKNGDTTDTATGIGDTTVLDTSHVGRLSTVMGMSQFL